MPLPSYGKRQQMFCITAGHRTSRTWLWLCRRAICALLIAMTARASASIPGALQPELPRTTRPLKPVIDWVVRTGRHTVIRANVAKALGFPDRDLEVRQRAFLPAGAEITEVFAVPVAMANVAVLSRLDESTGAAVVWRSDASGITETTVSVHPVDGVQAITASPENVQLFERVRSFFVQQQSAAGAARQPSASANGGTAGPNRDVKSPAEHHRGAPFASEISALGAAPWLLIAIPVVLYITTRPTRRSNRPRD